MIECTPLDGTHAGTGDRTLIGPCFSTNRDSAILKMCIQLVRTTDWAIKRPHTALALNLNCPGFGSDHDVSWVPFPWHMRIHEARACSVGVSS